MSQNEEVDTEKLKSLFQGLGKSTNRGIKKCPKCGTVNGTRGNSCKNRACDVLFRHPNGAAKKSTTDACKIDANIPGMQVYSVRQRDKGPDYRSFVSFPVKEGSEDVRQQERPKSAKCYKAACNKLGNPSCCHIEAAKRCLQMAEPLYVKGGTASVLNIPSDQQEVLSTYLSETSVLAQRVSKTTFVVKCEVSSKTPLGLLHIMFFQNKKEEKIDKKFLCACKPPKGREGDIPNPSETGESSKLCVHYHACLLAFASDSNLAAEFSEFLVGHCPCKATLLSQLHLVTLPHTIETTSLEGIESNHISVEIMHENMSLLESIAAVDDVTLHSVQGLEGVLSDQIIVTNVDDSLSFTNASALEGLDDGDSQVCQIFSNAQNTIQLPFTTSNCDLETINLASAVLTTTTGTSNISIQNMCRKRKQDDDERDLTLTYVTASNGEGESKSRRSDGNSLPCTTVTFSSPLVESPSTHQDIREPPSSPQKSSETRPTIPNEFDIWLAGVNERLNAVMNYKFPGKPDPIVYYISSEIFEHLRERITAGVKKKRLPNQTVIITRNDKPPAGVFTKHVWKLTNMHHIVQIFNNPIIPLKTSQYFIRSGNGLYECWSPPNETDRKNQAIKPHLHSTYLKVGKDDNPNESESTPFVIEWIADILPQSRLGELTLSFEFGHHAPNRQRE